MAGRDKVRIRNPRSKVDFIYVTVYESEYYQVITSIFCSLGSVAIRASLMFLPALYGINSEFRICFSIILNSCHNKSNEPEFNIADAIP